MEKKVNGKTKREISSLLTIFSDDVMHIREDMCAQAD